jgi:hypothetical protein
MYRPQLSKVHTCEATTNAKGRIKTTEQVKFQLASCEDKLGLSVKFSYCTKFGCQKPGALQYKNFTIPSSCNASNNQIKMQMSNWQQAQLLVVLSCTMTLHTKANYATHQVIYII